MQTLPVLDPKAAGIDVGSETLHVSIAGDTPEVFGTTTGQLHALRDWLKEKGVHSAAMEATGVYWLCAYEVLETAGLEVLVVNGKHVKNLPGRKTDLKDCQWIATLHAHGLLRSGFVPPEHIRRLQDYLRLRADHVTMAASHVQHLQKALERMNVKLHDVISSVVGVSGLKVRSSAFVCRWASPRSLPRRANTGLKISMRASTICGSKRSGTVSARQPRRLPGHQRPVCGGLPATPCRAG